MCRAWLPAFRSLRFEYIKLGFSEIYHRNSLILDLIYAKESTIPLYVHNLWLDLYTPGYCRSRNFFERFNEELPKLLPLFTNMQSLKLLRVAWEELDLNVRDSLRAAVTSLTILELHHVRFETTDQFFQLLSSAAYIEELIIQSVTVTTFPVPVYPSTVLNRLALIPYKKLKIGNGDCSSILIEWLLQSHMPPRHKMNISIDYNSDYDALPLLVTYIHRLGSALEHLSLSQSIKGECSMFLSGQKKPMLKFVFQPLLTRH